MKRLSYFFALVITCVAASAQDAEMTHWKSGISATWGGTKGVDYMEEYRYHDKIVTDDKIVYLKDTTTITLANNARNLNGKVAGTGWQVGINGADGIANTGDEGRIRYRLDRDMQYALQWANSTDTNVHSLYTAPFTLASQEYQTGVPVVGTTGHNGGAATSRTARYYRGTLDSFGDEWHVMAFANDNRLWEAGTDIEFVTDDGRLVHFVVNPKTPGMTVRATGDGQFYTTPAKAYWTPKVCAQTTYFNAGTGTVTFEIRDLYGNNVFYRIGGGSFIDAGTSHVTLDQDDFASGSNTLQYYYSGNIAYTKTRTVVKNPTHPSLAESHGNSLWEDSTKKAEVLARLSAAPYATAYGTFRGRPALGHYTWDRYANQGLRWPHGYGSEQPVFKNAFVALKEGFTYIPSGSTRSVGTYAIEMIQQSPRNIWPIGFESNHKSAPTPSMDIIYIGYYDCMNPLEEVMAYDLIVANFRSDQVTGGLTPVQDYYVRDNIASFAYEGMQTAGRYTDAQPGHWGGSRMLVGCVAGIIMHEYSTPYYGTSGFGTVQTTYPTCPFPDVAYTWKDAMYEEDTPKTAFPNLMYCITYGETTGSIFTIQGEVFGGHAYDEGFWTDKQGYSNWGHAGRAQQVFANVAGIKHGWSDRLMQIYANGCADGTAIFVGDGYPQTPAYADYIAFWNERFPDAWLNGVNRFNSLPIATKNSTLTSYAPYGFAYFDAEYTGTTDPDAIPDDPSSLNATTASSSVINLTWTDNSADEDYFEVQRSLDNSIWETAIHLDANVTSYSSVGLTGGTLYYYRVRAGNAEGASDWITDSATTDADVVVPVPPTFTNRRAGNGGAVSRGPL